MERFGPGQAPRSDSVWQAVRAATAAVLEDASRFVPANLAVALWLVVGVVVASRSPIGLLLMASVVAPAAGLMRMATRHVRTGSAPLSALVEPVRRPGRVIGFGVGQLVVAVVLVVDLLIGLTAANLFGAFLSVAAFYGLIALTAYATVAWPLLLDPVRDAEPVGRLLRLAAALLVARPLWLGALAGVVSVIVLASSLAVVVVLTFGLALGWLVAAHAVLPAADRFEASARGPRE